MKFVFIGISALFLGFSSLDSNIELIGSTEQIMKKGDLSANIDLSIKEFSKNSFGIGAIENLQGEMIVFQGKSIYSGLDEKRNPLWLKTQNKKAIFFVKSEVKKWKKIKMPTSVQNRLELYETINKEAIKLNLDTLDGFVFKAIAHVNSLHAHIAFLRKETIENFSPAGKKNDDFPLELKNQTIDLIGFAGKNAAGRFAMPSMGNNLGSNMHFHYISRNKLEAGHVEQINIKENWTLYLPIYSPKK